MPPVSSSKNSKSYLPFFIIGIVLILALAGGVWLFKSSSPNNVANTGLGNATSAPSITTTTAQNNTRTTPQPGAQPPHMRGEASAPVTLEEFGDFQCPPCARLHPELKKIEAEYGSRLKVIFRNLPLSMHEHAVDAARAAEAAGRQGRFWQMHDKLYDNQNIWKNEPDVRTLFTNYAATLGLNVEQFKRDWDSMEVANRIAADLMRANSLNVNGTPAVFVNGRQLETEAFIGSTAGLRAEVDAVLSGKQK